MTPDTIARIRDQLGKMAAKTNLVGGGTQYTPDVSLAVAGMNRGKAMLRGAAPARSLPRPLPLSQLQKMKP